METRLANRTVAVDLPSVLKATECDTAGQVAGVRSRIERFLDENNVSMMGGWT